MTTQLNTPTLREIKERQDTRDRRGRIKRRLRQISAPTMAQKTIDDAYGLILELEDEIDHPTDPLLDELSLCKNLMVYCAFSKTTENMGGGEVKEVIIKLFGKDVFDQAQSVLGSER